MGCRELAVIACFVVMLVYSGMQDVTLVRYQPAAHKVQVRPQSLGLDMLELM